MSPTLAVLAAVVLATGSLPLAPATVAADPVTGLAIQSDSFTRSWRPPATSFSAPVDQDGTDTVSALSVTNGSGYPYGTIWIGAPSGQALEVGVYEGATSTGGDVPRLFINETGCFGGPTGSFEVLELDHSGDTVTRLAFRFLWECPGFPVRHGEYRYDSTLDLLAPDLEPLSSGLTWVNFGDVRGGTVSSPQTVTLTNRGTADLVLSATTITGTHADTFQVVDDGCGDTTVVPGGSCTVDVQAAPPLEGGDHNASLTFSANTFRATFGASLSVRGLIATTVEILTPPSVRAFDGVPFTARVLPLRPEVQGGYVVWWLDGQQLSVGTPISAEGTTILAGSVGLGQHALRAVYHPPSQAFPMPAGAEATTTITGLNWVTVELTSDVPATVKQGTAQTFTATMTTGTPPSSGTLTIRNATSGQVMAAKPVTGTSTTLVTPSVTLPIGDTEIVAAFSGDPSFIQALASRTQTVVSDTDVEAFGQTASPSPFYPVADGYRDTLAIKGTAVEPLTVTIRIYNSSGKLVRTLSLGSKSGAYATTWNGRTSGGTLLSAGTYKVRHHLVDGTGNVRDIDRFVTLSHRKVKWVTTSITKYGSAYSASAKDETGTISTRASSFTKGVRIAGGSSPDGYAVTRWSFGLRSALAYKGLKISVLGKGTRSTSRALLLFGQDYIGTLVGPSYRWWSRSGGVSGHVNNRVVLLDVEADGPMAGAFDIAKTRVTYTYAVWP